MQEIVVGVDATAAGRAALLWALREAVARHVPLTAVHTWLLPVYGFTYPGLGSMPDVGPATARNAQDLVDDLVKQACNAVPGADTIATRAVITEGAPAQVLVSASANAALLVVGSRGEGALSRSVLGSVSSSVLHHAHCAVVVVPGHDEASGAEASPRVVVGVDHSPASLRALGVAVAQARRSGATLVPILVHEPSRSADAADLTALEGTERRRLLDAADEAGAQQAGVTGLRVEPEVLTGHPSASLTEFTEPQDLLVVGSRGRGGFTGLLLGSTSTQCAQHARCPVLVVRE